MASMNAPIPTSILHDGQGGEVLSAQRCANRTNLQAVFRGALCRSGRALALSNCRGPLQHARSAALAYQKQPNSFQQIGGRIHSSGEEYVSLRFMIVNSHLTRN